MVSDQDIGKKETELIELASFLEAHELVSGEELSIVTATENPDFICVRTNGGFVGIELTKVTREKHVVFWDRILHRKEEMDPFDAVYQILCLIERKDHARAERYCKRVPECILVLQLVDGTLFPMRWMFDGIQNDFTVHGFSEIWLADYSGLEAFGDIELFGLFPQQWWGYHERVWPYRKPYG